MSKQDRLPQIRVFVAVELPAEVREYLETLQFQINSGSNAARWVAPHLLHLTLRFLGEIKGDRLPGLEMAIRNGVRGISPFELCLTHTGAFPHAGHPRVLWAGFGPGAGVQSLLRLRAEIERSLGEYRFGTDPKPFSPHITIARVRDRSRPDDRQVLAAAWCALHLHPAEAARHIWVNEVTVMRSDLRPGGPEYIPIRRLPLGRMAET